MAIKVDAQLSPGDLSSAHAHLEGISNCTKCHVLGDKVSNDKCLECHKEIKSRISQKKGYHASAEVSGKDCFTCHSDHHGRAFEIIRFDIERFDHKLTGYTLTGQHTELECNACHNDNRIDSYELKKKKSTFLGLNTECISCHKDVHRSTLSPNCASCHTTESFAPATLFKHEKTAFPLKGKHQAVDCRQCHELTFADGSLFQKFDGVPFASCADCHIDVHNNKFGPNCKECHTEESFEKFVGKNSFNHNQTGFPLKGQHRRIDCASCHQMNGNMEAENAFQDFRGKNVSNCVACHEDVHQTRFGNDCRQCHTEESFRQVVNLDQFNHDLTDFPLQGKHEIVDCRKCHETKMTEPVPHQQCIDCHHDFHEGQFVANNIQQDCRNCHSVEGFASSSFTIEKHNEGAFPLTGAHLATPCFSCHLKNDEWTFRNIGRACIDCHTDVHAGQLASEYYPGQSCTNCHTSDSWSQVAFDHALTGFVLEGKHNTISCTSCHTSEERSVGTKKIPFAGLTQECTSCHENVHSTQFEIQGITDCKRCHGFVAWKPSAFNHNTARFVLDGAHQNVACEKCHKTTIVEGKEMVLYRLEQFECIACHGE